MPREIPELAAAARDGPEADVARGNIAGGIEWCFSEANRGRGEYEIIVRSGDALRRKWPQIRAAALRDEKTNPAAKRQSVRDELARRRAERQRAAGTN